MEAAGPPMTGVLPVHDICFVAIGRLLFACSLHTMSDPVDKKEQVLRVDTYFTYFPYHPRPLESTIGRQVKRKGAGENKIKIKITAKKGKKGKAQYERA